LNDAPNIKLPKIMEEREFSALTTPTGRACPACRKAALEKINLPIRTFIVSNWRSRPRPWGATTAVEGAGYRRSNGEYGFVEFDPRAAGDHVQPPDSQ
jgi:hypothetical protein